MNSAATLVAPAFVTFAEVLASVGDIPAHRVWVSPPPGEATEADVIRIHDRHDRLCELIDGVLVEKTVGAFESYLAVVLTVHLGQFVTARDLGIVLGADGAMRLAPRLVRIPDVAFIAWDQLPGRLFPAAPIPDLHPDFAVEVLSRSNSRREMDRKLRDYFDSGTRLVWYLDPERRQMQVYTSVDASRIVGIDGIDGILDGGEVLPGFELSMAKLFEIAPPATPSA